MSRLALGTCLIMLYKKQKNKYIPWSQIIGMRNRLIHGYDIIDYDLLWDTVNFDLPPLIRSLRRK